MERGEKMYEVTIDKETGLPVMDNSFTRVVRCKDCKWFHVEDWGEMWCDHTNGLTICRESYCSDGRRREDETD